MRMIIIDAIKKTVAEEVVVGPTLAFLQKNCGGTVDLIRMPGNLDLWVNDEFLINGTNDFFTIDGLRQWVGGVAVLASSNDEGDTIGLPDSITLDFIKELVKFGQRVEITRGTNVQQES
jgi:hypothetical protein